MFNKQNEGITLKTVDKDISSLINKGSRDKQSNKSKKKRDMMEPFHNIQCFWKTVVDCSNHSLDDIQLITFLCIHL